MRERRRPAGWGTIVLGSVIVLAGLVGNAAALSPTSSRAVAATPWSRLLAPSEDVAR